MTSLLRPFLSLDRHTSAVARLLRMLRDELFFALIPPSKRASVNASIYRRDRRYLPGGEFFEAGLFDWERRAISFFPKSGTILVGGAGAGREVAALRKLGYDTVAFEPIEEFCSAVPDLKIHGATYRDLIDDPTRFGSKFDAVILGWGSFSDLLSEETRRSLLPAIRKSAPNVPVLLSFLLLPYPSTGRIAALRHLLRGGAKDGDFFSSAGGFAHAFTPEEIKALAADAGYEAAYGNLLPYPHAVLVPNG